MSGAVYRDGASQWAAIKARAKARGGASEAQAIRRQLVYSRFLARVFADPSGPWVLKGGSATLMRIEDGRTTKDIDLLHEVGSPQQAVDALDAAARRDLGDHFRFVLTVKDLKGGAAQPDVEGHRVTVQSFCGTATADGFPVDLVTGSLMTGSPDAMTPSVLDVPGLTAPTVRLYPVVDHVADKLCAIQAKYGHGQDQPSSRVRDLVDLVLFARSIDVDGAALRTAIQAEWSHRLLDGEPRFGPPPTWVHQYPREARKAPGCAGYTDFRAAEDLVSRFLGPVLEDRADGLRWSAGHLSWSEPASTSPARPV